MIFFAVGLVLSSAVAIWELARHLRESALLRNTLRDILGSTTIHCREDLVKLKHFLNESIRFDRSRMNEARPLLRATARETLCSGYGFCGENARLTVRLLLLAGVRANRLYVHGPKWGHVLVEHQWDGRWVIFDGHDDECVLLREEDVARIPSDQLTVFPNKSSATHPWQKLYRIKLCYRFPPARPLALLRLPTWAVLISESPALIRGCLAVGLAVTLTTIWLAVVTSGAAA